MSNENLPIGPKTPDFEAPWPGKPTLKGKFVTLEPLSNDHAEDLFECLGGQENEYLFTYIPEGPWPDYESFLASIEAKVKHQTWMYLALVDPHTHRAIGYVSLMNIIPKFRTVEVGNVMFSPQIQRSPAGTECNYLLARYIFDLNYRRFEWKANSLNAKSRRAAERLGFTFEGIFRKHFIIKGRNRDTAWFSIVDDEWPIVKQAFEKWLADGNFDESGNQKSTLQDLRKKLLE